MRSDLGTGAGRNEHLDFCPVFAEFSDSIHEDLVLLLGPAATDVSQVLSSSLSLTLLVLALGSTAVVLNTRFAYIATIWRCNLLIVEDERC